MRKLLTLDQLLDAMNSKLVSHGTCSDCRFNTIVPLEVADESGCNWSHANFNCIGHPAGLGQSYEHCMSTSVCRPQAERVIAEAKQHYNVR